MAGASPWEDFEAPGQSKGPWEDFLPHPQTSGGQAALEHFGNAAALGYLPQIQSATSQLVGDPNAKVDENLRSRGFKITQPDSGYIADRDSNSKRLQTEEQEHPYASTAGTIGGALASGAAVSAVAPINAATRFGRIAQAAKGSAILGALSNPGDTEGKASGLQMKDRSWNALTAGGIGAAGQTLVEGASAAAKAVTDLPKNLTAKAEERAFKSSGAMLRDYRKAAGQDRINELGRYMLDNGLVKPGMSVDDIAEAAQSMKDQKGSAIGKILEELSSHEAANGGPQVARTDIGSDVRSRLIQDANIPSTVKNNKYFEGLASELEGMGSGEKLSISELQKMKETAGKQINWKRLPDADIPIEEQFNRAVYGATKDALENRADSVANAIGRSDYTQLKSAYRNASDIEKISKDYALRQNANRFFSPTDVFSSGVGALMGFASGGDDLLEKGKHAAMGASLGLASKAARTYGTPLWSMALDKAGAALSRTPLTEIGQAARPVLNAIEKSPAAVAASEGVMSRARLSGSTLKNVADEDSKVNRSPARGEDKWAQQGIKSLGISDPAMTEKLMSDPKAKQLLIQASHHAPGSKASKNIMNKIQAGWGAK